MYQANKQIALCLCCKYFFNQENFSKLNYFAFDHSIGFLFCPIFTFWNQMRENIRQKSSNVKMFADFLSYVQVLPQPWTQNLRLVTSINLSSHSYRCRIQAIVLQEFRADLLPSDQINSDNSSSPKPLTLCTGSKYNT